LRRWRNLTVGILISAVFLWIALRNVDLAQVQAVLRGARWEAAPLVLILWWGGLAARVGRWHSLMNRRVRLRSVYHIHNIGFLINSTLPFRIGELARAYLVSHENAGVSGLATLSSIFTERVLDVLTLVVTLALVLPLLPLESEVMASGMVVGAAGVAAFIVLLLSARLPGWMYRILAWGAHIAPFLERLHPLVERVVDGLKPLTTRSGLVRVGLWTAMVGVFGLLEVWSLALLFPDWPQTTAAYGGLALALVGASLSIIIPFTPAGVGPFEAAVIFALTTAGVPGGLSATYAVVWHAGIVLFYAAWGVIGLLAMGLSFDQVWRGATATGQQASDIGTVEA